MSGRGLAVGSRWSLRVFGFLTALSLAVAAVGLGAAPASARTVTGGVGVKPFFKMLTQALTDRMGVGVNVVSGNLVVHSADLRLVGTGLNVAADRYYNSQAAATSLDMGAGWSMSTGTDEQLTFNQDGSVNYFDSTGATWVFSVAQGGGYTAPSGVNATLTKNSDGSYSLFFARSGQTLDFGSDGYLTRAHDKNVDGSGNPINVISFSYTTVNGRKSLSSIKDTKGRTTTVAYDPTTGFVSSVTDPKPRTLQYGYDSNGNMTSSHDEDGAIYGYQYDAGHHLTRIEDPDGNFTTISYDAQNRVSSITRVTNTSNMTGSTTGFSYGTGHGCSKTGDSTTVVTDPNSHQTTYCFDPNDAKLDVDQVIDANGNPHGSQYNSNGDLQSFTEGGSTWQLSWDTSTNALKSIQTPGGATWTLNYNTGTTHPNLPDSSVDAQGHTTSYGYDNAWNLTSVSNGPSNTQINRNQNGTANYVQDANGNKTYYHYNANWDLTEVDPPTAPPAPTQKITMTYDAVSRLSSITYANGTSISYTYDELDRPTKITYGDGTSYTYTYDANGNLLTRVDRSNLKTTYTYDALNRQTSKAGPGSGTISYTYDAASNLLTLTDASGTTTYVPNPVNLPKQITDSANDLITFAYNTANNLTDVYYPNNVHVVNTYDGSQRLTEVKATNTSTSATLEDLKYSYANPTTQADTGLWQQVIDNVANTTTNYTYDTLNRVTKAAITGNTSATYNYGYDNNGNLTNYNGTTFSYNALNEITNSGYSYDAAGQETAGAGTTYTYNAANQTTNISQSSGSQAMTYANAGQSEISAVGSTTITTAVLGVSSTTNSSGTSYYARTPKGALLDERTPVGKYYYLFDGLGSVVALTDVNGNAAKTYTYDPYGIQTGGTGTGIPNLYRYAGEYNLDPVGGIYHIGDRYYNNGQGSWTQQDPASHVGNLTHADPYTYAGDNPVSNADPSGHDFFSSIQNTACAVLLTAAICGSAQGAVNPEYGITDYLGSAPELIQSAEQPVEDLVGQAASEYEQMPLVLP